VEVVLIFPNQLFTEHPALRKDRKVFLLEENLFFRQYCFHKKKLIFHRASMKYYAGRLQHDGFDVTYAECGDGVLDVRTFIAELPAAVKAIHVAAITDDWLKRRMEKAATKAGIAIIEHPAPDFLTDLEEAVSFFKQKKRYFQADFYIHQRKKMGILLDAGGQPLGGKWSFDADNREKLPANHRPQKPAMPVNNPYYLEARQYVDTYFTGNSGDSGQLFGVAGAFYPVTHKEAADWLTNFIAQRLVPFGTYEDAMHLNDPVIYHSVLSPLLNCGLLTPAQVIDAAMAAATELNIPLNSLEGFIRQVIGWREYIRVVYDQLGVVQRTKNIWGFTRKIPASFWTGNTGIAPVDHVIKNVLNNAYSHHIERLMIMGNFMLLCQFDPDEVYRWFMEMYIDAYDWVMVPNVYGMTQFSDGGLIVTKPYISGSNYLMKMGTWPKGAWQAKWDALFWNFMHTHRNYFAGNIRMKMLLSTFDKMTEEKRKLLLDNAADYLDRL
jgi:deoxyribodipyrimidine photolyase-related protein